MSEWQARERQKLSKRSKKAEQAEQREDEHSQWIANPALAMSSIVSCRNSYVEVFYPQHLRCDYLEMGALKRWLSRPCGGTAKAWRKLQGKLVPLYNRGCQPSPGLLLISFTFSSLEMISNHLYSPQTQASHLLSQKLLFLLIYWENRSHPKVISQFLATFQLT